MRICLLSGEVLGARHGGAVHTTEVARALTRKGHEVLLVTPGTFADDDIRHISCPMRSRGVTRTGRARIHESTIREFAPELVYERQLIGGGYGGQLGRSLGVPVVYEVNSPHLQEMLHRFPWLRLAAPLLKAREKRMFADCDLVVTTHDRLVPGHYLGNRLVGPWAVRAPQDVEPIAWPELEGQPVVLVAGSFRDWHGTDHVEAVMRELDTDAAGLVLVGGGESRRQLARRLRDSLPGPVVDGGTLDATAMASAYRRSHVLLAPFDPPLPDFPFYYSPFKVLEALSHGLPVVTDDHDNLRELLDADWCGSCVAGRDPVRWADALRATLDGNPPDGERGRVYASRHSWDDHVDSILGALP